MKMQYTSATEITAVFRHRIFVIKYICLILALLVPKQKKTNNSWVPRLTYTANFVCLTAFPVKDFRKRLQTCVSQRWTF